MSENIPRDPLLRLVCANYVAWAAWWGVWLWQPPQRPSGTVLPFKRRRA